MLARGVVTLPFGIARAATASIQDRVLAYEAFHRESGSLRDVPVLLLRLSDRGLGDNLQNDVEPLLGFAATRSPPVRFMITHRSRDADVSDTCTRPEACVERSSTAAAWLEGLRPRIDWAFDEAEARRLGHRVVYDADGVDKSVKEMAHRQHGRNEFSRRLVTDLVLIPSPAVAGRIASLPILADPSTDAYLAVHLRTYYLDEVTNPAPTDAAALEPFADVKLERLYQGVLLSQFKCVRKNVKRWKKQQRLEGDTPPVFVASDYPRFKHDLARKLGSSAVTLGGAVVHSGMGDTLAASPEKFHALWAEFFLLRDATEVVTASTSLFNEAVTHYRGRGRRAQPWSEKAQWECRDRCAKMMWTVLFRALKRSRNSGGYDARAVLEDSYGSYGWKVDEDCPEIRRAMLGA